MSTLTATATPAAGVPQGLVNPLYVQLDIRRVLRNRRTLIFTLVMPVVFYFSFGAPQPGADAKAYVMLSFAVYGAMVAATSVGASVAVERASGWSRQLRLTPMRPATYVASKVISAASIAVIPVAVELVIGAATGARMRASAWVVGGLVAWIGSLVFAALGLAIGYLVPSENAMQVMGPVLALLALLGGLFVPLSIFSHTLQTVASFTPAYGVGVLAHWQLSHDGSFAGAIANLVVWTALFATGAALLFRRDTGRV